MKLAQEFEKIFFTNNKIRSEKNIYYCGPSIWNIVPRTLGVTYMKKHSSALKELNFSQNKRQLYSDNRIRVTVT